MATISDDKKSPAQKANDARAPFDGPHRAVKKKHSGTNAAPAADAAPSYVVAVTKREKTSEDDPSREVQHTYNPQELRAKARAFMKSSNVNPEEKRVLEDILGEDEPEAPKSGKA